MLAWLERYTGIAEVWLRIPANCKPEFLPAFFSQMQKSASLACVADVRNGRGKEFGRETASCAPQIPFPFPFERLSLRL